MKAYTLFALLLWAMIPTLMLADDVRQPYQPQFSTAGFFALEGTGRDVYSMNPAWRFAKGDVPGAQQADFDDSRWEAVSLPHGIEYLPTEASGCINYQGVVWYRKHFTPEASWQGRRTILHFEAIMGKCRVYVNGTLLREHFGGYLPVVMDVTDALRYDQDNVIAVWADNSDDASYPPGKFQNVLDYTYCGGIYRDCWMVVHAPVHITDANLEQEVAGGGLLVAFDNVSTRSADVLLQLHLRNQDARAFQGSVEYQLALRDGTPVARLRQKVNLPIAAARTLSGRITVQQPLLWTPTQPTLYHLDVRLRDSRGHIIDGYRQRVGIRSIEFRGAEGFFLNGERYPHPLIGANRHQDFAIVGNAVSNSLHWRDAKKLRDAGLQVIRNAHCPQDPAFMDACDELGLFVIDNTPGWQFWNEDLIFAQRVYDDIRNLVRRDRNHPSLWLWEPILNETWYPADFAQNAKDIVHAEFPYSSCYCASDERARGSELFPVLFAHPMRTVDGGNKVDSTKTYFTREWGDNVDNWSAHNSNSRVARNWGERPMLVQAAHYADLDNVTNYDILYRQAPQHVGGCLWHSFDHQRGYHPDPFYGGIMDNFRQPKYSYQMFRAQRPAQALPDVLYETGPMVFIAHEMTPFSDNDVQVYSNCDEVRLTYGKNGKPQTLRRDSTRTGMPHPIFTFPGAYDFMVDKRTTMARHGDDIYLLAEGLIDGQVVATHRIAPCRRPSKIILWVDNDGVDLRADGSDCVTVVAAIADDQGHVKRLNNEYIKFEIEGEGRLLGDASIHANPAPVRWGTAPVLVQSTLSPGDIRIRASLLYPGAQKAAAGELILHSQPAAHPAIYDAATARQIPTLSRSSHLGSTPASTPAMTPAQLQEVERQQREFGE